MLQSLEELVKIIREKKKSSPDKSYTNKLLNDKKLSLDKVKEEVNELIKIPIKFMRLRMLYIIYWYILKQMELK